MATSEAISCARFQFYGNIHQSASPWAVALCRQPI